MFFTLRIQTILVIKCSSCARDNAFGDFSHGELTQHMADKTAFAALSIAL